MNIVLFEPEIPPNTGNIMRLCAATGASLHLIEPLGFSLEDKQLKRAGLDYEMSLPYQRYKNFLDYLSKHPHPERIFYCSTKAKMQYQSQDALFKDSFSKRR